ncbi:hypothetical protein [Sphingobacterium sp.]|uniref:hypothetical protein n=1 Tax=Sphingobacterium sp. TaxID=341027 RepID=UPI00289C06D8|nr:hypothetical protein [Sphingobacterium sp.]
MIDLRQKNVDNKYFEKCYSTAAKDVVSAVYYEKDRLFIADWKSNLYCIDTTTNIKKWEVKLKNPILFEFIPFNQKLYALNENTLFEIDVATGHVEEKIHFVLIGSVVHCQHTIYLNERSKKGPKTTGRILEVNLKNFLVTTIKEEQQKSTFGMLTKKEIAVVGDQVFFYCDQAIYQYNVSDRTMQKIYENHAIENRIQAIHQLGKGILFVPGMKNPDAGKGHFPSNAAIHMIFQWKPISGVRPIDQTLISSTIPFRGNEVCGSDNERITTYGGYVFFSKGDQLKIVEIPDRDLVGQDGYLYKQGNAIYLLVPQLFDDKDDLQGFGLYKIEEHALFFLEKFITNTIGAKFKIPEFDFFGEKIVVRCEGQVYLLSKISD